MGGSANRLGRSSSSVPWAARGPELAAEAEGDAEERGDEGGSHASHYVRAAALLRGARVEPEREHLVPGQPAVAHRLDE